MTWMREFDIEGHKVNIIGDWDSALCLSAEEIESIGEDMSKVLRRFLSDHLEIELIEEYDGGYRYGGGRDNSFSNYELQTILKSQYSNERVKKAAYNQLHNIQEPKPPPPPPKKKDTHGFVYLIKSGDAYKIGKSKNVSSRVETFSITLPHPVELIHTVEREDYDKAEQELHERFAPKRMNGEWFNLSEEDVEYFRSLA